LRRLVVERKRRKKERETNTEKRPHKQRCANLTAVRRHYPRSESESYRRKNGETTPRSHGQPSWIRIERVWSVFRSGLRVGVAFCGGFVAGHVGETACCFFFLLQSCCSSLDSV